MIRLMMVAVIVLMACEESPILDKSRSVDLSLHLVGEGVVRAYPQGFPPPKSFFSPAISRVKHVAPRVKGTCDFASLVPSDSLIHKFVEFNPDNCEAIIVTGNWRNEILSIMRQAGSTASTYIEPIPRYPTSLDPSFSLSGPNVRRIGLPPDAPPPKYRILVNGSRLPDGTCNYEDHRTRVPGMTVVYTEVDDSKCQAIVTLNDWRKWIQSKFATK